MKYRDFKTRIENLPFFSIAHLSCLTDNEQVLRNQLVRWKKQGLLFSLKKGLYVLNEGDRKIHPSRLFIANVLFFPSYISCEYALSFYDLIPEKVETVTSVTSKRTSCFDNVFGAFYYHHVRQSSFLGFRQIEDENKFPVFIAAPEKAILDFFYLNLPNFSRDDKDIFENSYRLQNLSYLDSEKLKNYAQTFSNKKLLRVVENFCEFLNTRR